MRVWTRSTFVMAVLGAVSAMPAQGQDGNAQVVVRAVARDGQPVLDLKPADITVRVDGSERAVKALELVRPSESASESATTAPVTSNLPAPYATNASAAPAARGSREVIIAVDDEGIGIGREQQVREAIGRLVAGLEPGDRVGLLAMKQGGLSVSPSTRHAAVTEALPKLIAIGSSTESASNLACRTKVILGSIAGLLRGASPDRTIVFFSPGLSPIMSDQMRGRFDQSPTDTGLCQIRTNDLEDLGRAASASAAEMYVVYHSEGMSNPANLSIAHGGLENVAGSSGAEMLRLTGNGEAVAARIAGSAGFYYLATLEPAGSRSAPRRVEARTSREGVRLAARPVGSVPPAPGDAKAGTPREMLRVPSVFRDVSIRTAAFVSRQAGAKDLKLIALFEPEDPSVKLTAAAVGLFDEKGTLKAQWTAQPNELGRTPLLAALAVPPGKYRMRVAGTDSSGKGGTTDYDVAVRLTEAAPVTISDMVLGVNQGGFSPKLAYTAADAAAIGLIEIYGVQKDTKVEVVFEILHGTELMGSGAATIGPGQAEDERRAYGGFGIATLAPGDYTMRAMISVDGKQAGVAARTMRKLN